MSVTIGDPPETEIVCPWCNGERVVVQMIAGRTGGDGLGKFAKPHVVHSRRERSCPRCGGRGTVPVDSKPPTAEELKAWEEMKG